MPTATAVEKMAEDVYKAMNMATHRARNSTTKRGTIFVTQSNDIFGVFDIIAIDPVSGYVYLDQVTRSRGAASQRRKKIEAWVKKHKITDEVLHRSLFIQVLIYQTQRNRSDSRRVDKFFYRERFDGDEWIKMAPLDIFGGEK